MRSGLSWSNSVRIRNHVNCRNLQGITAGAKMLAALLAASAASANTITFEAMYTAEIGSTVEPRLYEPSARPSSSLSAFRRCRRLAPTHCFGKKSRLFGCCAYGGSASSGSGQDDLGNQGFTLGPLTNAGNAGIGSFSGGAFNRNANPASIQDKDPNPVIPVSSVPGPIAGAGVPGLFLLGSGLFLLVARPFTPSPQAGRRHVMTPRV